MILTNQTDFGMGTGNCFSACVASIMEFPLDEVPNFCSDEAEQDGHHWLVRVERWVTSKGWGMIYSKFKESPIIASGVYAIACGRMTDTEYTHAVIVRCFESGYTLEDSTGRIYRGEIGLGWVHDPNPKHRFLDSVESLVILVPPIVCCSKSS